MSFRHKYFLGFSRRWMERFSRRSAAERGRAATPRDRSAGPNRRAEPGLTSLTLLFAVAAVIWQAVEVSENFGAVLSSPLWIVPYVAWSGLFALGAFATAALVDRSAMASVLARYITFGAGPLALSVIATALVMGPLVSTSPPSSYFRDPLVWNYLLNIVGWPHLGLPGVFEFNNVAGVANDVLWAVPCAALTVAVALVPWRKGAACVVAVAAAAAGLLWAGDEPVVATAAAATIAAQVGIVGYEMRVRALGSTPAVAATGFALCALAVLGRHGGLSSLHWLVLVAILSALLATGLAGWRLPLRNAADAAQPLLPAMLVSSFPILQLVSGWRALQLGTVGNALAAAPLIAVATAAFMLASQRLAMKFVPDLAPRLQPIAGAAPGSAAIAPVRNRRRLMPAPMLLALAGVAFVVIVVLAMTVFALQRKPWEN